MDDQEIDDNADLEDYGDNSLDGREEISRRPLLYHHPSNNNNNNNDTGTRNNVAGLNEISRRTNPSSSNIVTSIRQDHLQTLIEMGFDRTEAMSALMSTNNDIQRATDILIS